MPFFSLLFQLHPVVSLDDCEHKPMHFIRKKKIPASPTQEDHFAPEIEYAILGMQPGLLKNSSARSSRCHAQLCQLPGQTDRVPVGRSCPHKAINDHGALQQANWCLAGRGGEQHRPGSQTLLLPPSCPLPPPPPRCSPPSPRSCCSWKASTPDTGAASPNVAP